jgi:hypothetical protein
MVHNIIIINLLIRRLFRQLDLSDYYDIARYGDPSNLPNNYQSMRSVNGVALMGALAKPLYIVEYIHTQRHKAPQWWDRGNAID